MRTSKVLTVFMVAFTLILCTFANAKEQSNDDLAWVLTGISSVKALKPVGTPDKAKGENLYDLINGGAGVYLQHGFKQAILQDYAKDGGTLFNVEIYLLDSAENVKKLYALKSGSGGKKSAIGQGGSIHDYYGLFWQGKFYISVTAANNSPESKKLLEQIAKAVVKKIQAGK
jgi:hypothetical protein